MVGREHDRPGSAVDATTAPPAGRPREESSSRLRRAGRSAAQGTTNRSRGAKRLKLIFQRVEPPVEPVGEIMGPNLIQHRVSTAESGVVELVYQGRGGSGRGVMRRFHGLRTSATRSVTWMVACWCVGRYQEHSACQRLAKR